MTNVQLRGRSSLSYRVSPSVATHLVLAPIFAAMVLSGGGCVIPPLNTTDPNNMSATYIGSQACMTCHPDIGALYSVHGHSQMLKPFRGEPPVYPPVATRAGVPNPPDSLAWTDLRYVIGGYFRSAEFIDANGFVMTDGVWGFNTAWNLDFLPNGTVPGFVPSGADQTTPVPYDYANCLRCHTTGASPAGHQEGLPGVLGTFAEGGVGCERCHGPGSKHPPVAPRNIYINPEASFCGNCHSNGDDPNILSATDGFIADYSQYQELLSSPHAAFRCVTCHDPHTSVTYDPNNAIINGCLNCHPNQNMALHAGKVLVRGDYVEFLSCVSCHMPYASKSASSASPAVVGAVGRMGDMRSHIWNINTNNVNYTAMFSPDGSTVVKDASGQASVTVDFVCIRCHNGISNAFALTVKSASEIAPGLHLTPTGP